jgi:hypothetical protein
VKASVWQRGTAGISAFCVRVVLFLAIAALTVVPLAITAGLYMARRRVLSEHPDCQERLPRAVAFRAFLVESAATAAILALQPSRWLRRRSEVTTDATAIAILLPDVAVPDCAYDLLRRRLRRAGWEFTLGTDHALPRDLDIAVGELDQRLRKIARADVRLALIGHGSGGLVARRYHQRTLSQRLHAVATLGTPHQGTETPLCRIHWLRQMQPGSPLLRELAAADGIVSQDNVIAIYSDFDAWLAPIDRAYYPGAFNIEVRGVGHYSALASRKISGLLIENLNAARASHIER